MAQQKIELRKIRDLSENLNDTFTFIRQNFKPLVTSFLAIAGIFMLATSILNGVYQGRVLGEALKDIIPGSGNIYRSPFWMINRTFVIGRILEWLNLTAMTTVITCYFKIYDRKNGAAPAIDEVWVEFTRYFFKILLYSIPIGLLTIAGFLFCLVPGIYFAVVFTPFSIAVIIDDLSFGEAWDKCFTIIKNNFWSSLALYFIVYLIYAVTAGIISAGSAFVAGLISYFTLQNISRSIGVFTSVLNMFSFVFYIVVYVSVILQYFNLTERHYGIGMMNRIDRLGQTGNDHNNIQEQY